MAPAAAGRLLVLVPAWDEESCVGTVVKEVQSLLPEADVLVIDDGSTDRTAEVAAQAGAKVLSLPYNLGVGGAMRAGYRYAVRVDLHPDVVAAADGVTVPGAHRSADPEAVGQRQYLGAGLRGDLRRAVGRPVVDDEDVGLGQQRLHLLDHRPDAGLLIPGRNQHQEAARCCWRHVSSA